MVEHAKDFLRAVDFQRVIQAAHQVQQCCRQSEDDAGCQPVAVARMGTFHNAEDKRRNA